MSTPTIGDTWFRYEDIQYASPCDEWGTPGRRGTGRLVVSIQEFFVAKITPCGVRLHTGRFVLNRSTKRYACATKEEALKSFIARKICQASIHQAHMKRAELAIFLAEQLKGS